MAKMYYNLEEAMQRLGVSEDQLKNLVREGKLREFRDAGKLNYRVDEVDRLATGGAATGHDSGELRLEDTGEIPLASLGDDTGAFAKALSGSGSTPAVPQDNIDLSSDTGVLSLGGSTELKFEDSKSGTGALKLEDTHSKSGSGPRPGDSGSRAGTGAGAADSGILRFDDSKSGSGALKLDDSKTGGSGSRAGDVLSLDEVDKDAIEGMKKDDTVITNIGISVFDDDDLEIAADPMAKTLMTGGDEHLGLDGSGGGSGLLDLTRESDDTSLGAELLEGIDMGDTAETVAQSVDVPPPASSETEEEEALALPGVDTGGMVMAPAAVIPGGYVEPASPAFTGLLIVASIVLFLAGATAIAMSIGAWPTYLDLLAKNFWAFLGGSIALGGIAAGIGYVVGQPRTPKAPKPAKEKKVKEKKEKKAK